MTLREWAEAHRGSVLDGVVLKIPAEHRLGGVPMEAALRSVWAMGENDEKRGLWVSAPGEQRVFPLFDLDPEEIMSWEVVE